MRYRLSLLSTQSAEFIEIR